MVTPSLSLSIHGVQKTFTFCSFPTPKVSPVLSQMLCKIQQAFITPGMFRWFIRQYHLPFSLPETCAADILQGNACSSSLKGWWQALEIRWAGFLVLDGRIIKEGRKKASSLLKNAAADQFLCTIFLKSWALISKPPHTEAQSHTPSWLLLSQLSGMGPFLEWVSFDPCVLRCSCQDPTPFFAMWTG